MSKNFVQSALLRSTLVGAYRAYAQTQFWRVGSKVFVNSIPKAGTHLVVAELARFRQLRKSGLHIDNRSYQRTDPTCLFEGTLQPGAFRRAWKSVRPGQIFSGHIKWASHIEHEIAAAKVKHIFVIRDPRDIVMSEYYYVTHLRRHRLHNFLSSIDSEENCLKLMIEGTNRGPGVRSLKDKLAMYAPWLESEYAYVVRFEELVGQRGGMPQDTRCNTLVALARHCEIDADEANRLAAGWTGNTATLHKGQAFGWRSTMPQRIVEFVQQSCADELAKFGYESA